MRFARHLRNRECLSGRSGVICSLLGLLLGRWIRNTERPQEHRSRRIQEVRGLVPAARGMGEIYRNRR